MPIGYKVVDFHLRSCVHYYKSSVVQYGIGETTKPLPGNGPLAVFALESDALEFYLKQRGDSLGFSVFKCSYKRSKSTSLWTRFFDIYEKKRLRSRVSYRDVPNGTVFARSVTLLEKLEV